MEEGLVKEQCKGILAKGNQTTRWGNIQSVTTPSHAGTREGEGPGTCRDCSYKRGCLTGVAGF